MTGILYIIAESAAAMGVILSIVLVAMAWHALPSEIAIHFGISGKPDGCGPRWVIVAVPGVALSMWALFTIVGCHAGPAGDPVMRWLLVVGKADVAWVFTYITWKTVQVAMHKADGLGRLFLPLSLLIVALTIGATVLACAMAYRQ